MKRHLPVFAGLGLLIAGPASSQSMFSEVYKLTENGEWGTGALDLTVSISAPRDVGKLQRWIAERRRIDTRNCGTKSPQGFCQTVKTFTYGWIDSDTCPQLIPALQELAAIPIPPFAGTDGLSEFYVTHQPMLTIEGFPQPSPGGFARSPRTSTLWRVSVSEQLGFFRNWWDKPRAAIEPCWTPAAPVIDGKPLWAKLRP